MTLRSDLTAIQLSILNEMWGLAEAKSTGLASRKVGFHHVMLGLGFLGLSSSGRAAPVFLRNENFDSVF
jgi:hypothetical protein